MPSKQKTRYGSPYKRRGSTSSRTYVRKAPRTSAPKGRRAKRQDIDTKAGTRRAR